jgi:hypothetical protein
MRKADAYPSKYFKAADFADDWTLTVEVEMARMEEFPSDRGNGKAEKLVVYFRRQKSGLVVGPTIWDQFIEVTGEEDCDNWKGHHVELFRDWTQFGGKKVPCIRVRTPDAPPTKKPSKKAAAKVSLDYDDEIPM